MSVDYGGRCNLLALHLVFRQLRGRKGNTVVDVSARKQELIFKVVVNHEEQYSLWPVDRQNKRGWRDEGFKGTQEECTKYIRKIWKDMRPLSLRKELDEI